jgi:plastocyanin
MTHTPAPDVVPHHPRQPQPWRRPIRRVAIISVFGAAMFLASCSSGGSSTTNSTQSGASGSGGGKAITIQNFAFAPSTITVVPGAAVTVTNRDSVAHTVTSKTGGFDTGDIQAGQSKTFTAPNKAGSYPYICTIHQYMAGTLTVS